MNNVKIKLDEAGVRALLKSPAIAADCLARAQRVAAAAGDGYVAEKRTYPERTGAAVYPDTPKAYYDNLNHNTLLKAFGSGGHG